MEGSGTGGGATVGQYDIEVGGRVRRVGITKSDDGFAVTVDGRRLHVDSARIDAHVLSLIVDGSSFEVALAPDPAASHVAVAVDGTVVAASIDGRRRLGRKDDHGGAQGPQRIIAPMPGKVLRVLVKAGDAVTARQGLVVVEAMKMENELRAPRDGMVAEVPAREGQPVDAGALLVVVQ